MSRELRPAPPPREVNIRLIAAVGTVIWLIALVVLLLRRSTLAQNGDLVWLWTCAVGAGLGLLMLALTARRGRRSPVEADTDRPDAPLP